MPLPTPIIFRPVLVFASGTKDGRIYAFDATTGAELWSAMLPFVGSTSPMTYAVGGK